VRKARTWPEDAAQKVEVTGVKMRLVGGMDVEVFEKRCGSILPNQRQQFPDESSGKNPDFEKPKAWDMFTE
jgi:hypothetical protein